MRAVEARYGGGHSQVLFTATPKVETLLAHGTRLPDGRISVLDCHTQREAVAARYILNPLEFYTNRRSFNFEAGLEGKAPRWHQVDAAALQLEATQGDDGA